MVIVDDKRMSTLANCLEAAPHFQLDAEEAEEIIAGQVRTIRESLDDVCETAELGEVEKSILRDRMFGPTALPHSSDPASFNTQPPDFLG